TVSEQMKHFFALTPELVVLLDLQGTFLDSNPAWEKLLGLEIPSPAFGNLQSVCHPEDVPRVEQFLRTLGKGEETKNFELRLRNQKGEYLWISWSFAHATTDPIVFGVGRDVSAERRLQQNLQQAAQKEREASRLKSEFLANMSHEIRTPLNGVMGMIGLLQETRLDDYQEELLKIGNTSSRQLLDVITDILDLSKIEAGKMDLENRPFSLEELLSEIHTLFDIRASQKDIAFSIATDPSIPAQLIGDVPKIKQVLLNLVSNAVKFTESGTVSLGVQPVSPAEEKTLRLRFSVEDTGKGIPAEKHHLLFQLFSQVDGSITRKVGGSGLGLAICKRLVKIMSGTIGFESQPGIGSTFWMEIPLQYESTGTPREKTPTLPNTSKPREGIRVLLAEDDPLNQKIMKIWIRNCGWHMQLAENGRQALQMADPDKFDVVIMDVQMPEMDGLEATRKIRQRESFQGTQRLPIIALTAHAFREDQQKCLEAGMDDYTSKPVQPEELKRKICNLLVSRDPGKEP
ncbi:MAG TPA: ATP-binding protein, partial [Thermotogota bacterium]|nr:ATP-binding protein [Thermotogota bacterium]